MDTPDDHDVPDDLDVNRLDVLVIGFGAGRRPHREHRRRHCLAQGLVKGSMALVDLARSREIYAQLPPATEMSGGSAANTAVGVAAWGLGRVPRQGGRRSVRGIASATT